MLLILLNYFDNLCSTTIFRTRQNDDILRLIEENFGIQLCKCLLGFHAFTGSDQTGKFYGFSKLSCWKTLISSSPNILDAFCKLGTILDDEMKLQLEYFVLDLYCKSRPASVSTLGQLRWYLFAKFQHESTKLPPTRKAFEQKILRAHYTALQWKSSHISNPSLPDPNLFGWTWSDANSLYEPVMTTNLPAPESVIELSSCGCKGGCVDGRCRCFKNNLVCTEMCSCDNCENSDEKDDIDDLPESDEELEHSEDDCGFD